MSFSTDWDVDFYKTDYESDEHWELRKRFMEVHKDKFPEDELVCLAQVFTNIEFMGCKYPEETMQLVANLSQDVAREFRQERSKRLKRTFVQASDAAEARAKGRTTKMETPNSHKNESIESTNITSRKRQSGDKQEMGPPMKKSALPLKKIDLLAGLPFGNFILLLIGDRNCIQVSGQRCGITVSEREAITQNKKKIDIIVGGQVAGSADSFGIKEAKQLAFEAAMKKLQEECYTIKPRPNADRIDITKDNKTIKCSLKSSDSDGQDKIDKNNIGYKIMQKLGWSGGGLGTKNDGRENPVDYLIKNNRKGLGNDSDNINKQYFRSMLNNYINSDDIKDLVFDNAFTKDERATLHQIASEKNLKSSSHGKEPNRHLVISKKNITPLQILEEVLLNKNPMYMNKYEVKVPKKMVSKFPDYENFQTD